MKARIRIWRNDWLIGLCALAGPMIICTAVIDPATIGLPAICRAADGPTIKNPVEKDATKFAPTDKTGKPGDKDAKPAADKSGIRRPTTNTSSCINRWRTRSTRSSGITLSRSIGAS